MNVFDLYAGFVRKVYSTDPKVHIVTDSTDHCLVIQQMSTVPVTQNTSSYYFQHQGKSLKSRPFTCSECHKSFTQKHVLDDHFRIHTGEKPFVCSFCKRGFRQKNNLKRHVRSHHR